MPLLQQIDTDVRTGWSRASHNQVWSAVIATIIAAVGFGVFHTVDELLTRKSPPAPVERAEMKDGIWGLSRILNRCMPDGECIAPGHVVFDSIANDPLVGNEAYFMGGEGALVGSGSPDGIFPPGLSHNAAVFLLIHIVSPTA